MRRSMAIMVALGLCACAFAQDVPNLVTNPGFEQIEAGRPVGWELTGSVDLDNAQFYAGAMGLRMRHDERATSRASTTVKAGSREYLLLAWVRTEGVEGVGARLRVLTAGETLVAQSEPITGTGGWRRVSLSFNPGGVNEATIELSLADATGAAWFDNVIVGPRAEVAPLLADDEQQAQRENIALGKPYTLSPPPSYEYCTDPGDEVQLTDGEYTVGYFWTQASTVGWYLYSPQILVDLGQVYPIDGIMINCPGGGRAGVKFPATVTYYVSDDGERFHEVARLTPAGLVQDGSSWYTHRFLADDLNTRGRYVLIALEKDGSTVFADELEVYPGDHDPAAVTFAGEPVSRIEMAFAQYGITPRTYHLGEFPESPHVRWATPLSGGPVRAILMAYSGDMRDVCEIAQRVDLDYEPVQHFSFYRPTELGGLMREQIERTLPEAEVMVVGGFRWEAMPEALRAKVLARVREGMGLICVNPVADWVEPIASAFTESPLAGDQGVLDAIAMEALPDYRPPREAHFHLATFGEGRVARVRWGEFTGGAHSLLPDYDLDAIDDDGLGAPEIVHAALAKLILWAARREPQGTPASVERVWRDRQFDEQARETADATPGALIAEPEQRSALNGRNTVSAWLRDADGAVVDFAVHSYVVEHDAAIEAVGMAQPVFEVGQPVEATVRVVGDAAGLTLSARLVDTYGRLLSEQDAPVPAGGEIALSLPLEHPLTLAADLHTELRRGDEVLERRLDRAWIALEEDIDELIFCAWYAWDRQPTAHWGLRMLEAMGVDTTVSLPAPWRARNTAYANMRHGPENVERVYPRNTDDSLVREPCLSDPEHRRQVAERVSAMAAEMLPHGVVEWSLGDESTLGNRNYCHSETCLAQFREWLEREHGTLAALNASWGTNFAGWEEVVPATLEEVEGQANLGPWLDHRRYMEWLFTDYHWWLRELIEEQIPEARVGISGTPRPNSWSGHDWWQLMQNALTHLSGYGGVQRELQRSFMKPGTFYSTFLGYDYKDANEQKARYSPWDLLLHDASGINYYTLVSNTLNCPLVLPDGSMSRHAGWFFPEVQELKRGIGRMLIAADYAHDGIAVHYSPPSVHAATASGLWEHSNHLRNWQMNVTNIGRILQQCHYQFDFIHEQQMAAGELSNYRVLILPWSGAISDAEADAIREFVRNGGAVIADSWCGVRDDHGHAREMLADVLGVRQPLDPPPLEHGTLTLADPADGSLFGVTEVPVATGSPEIEPAGGRANASVTGAPDALVFNGFGEGRAVFLNCSFSNYAQVRATGVAGETEEAKEAAAEVTEPIRRFMRGLMDSVGVAPAMYVDAGARAHELEVSRLDLGEIRLVGVLRSITGGPIDLQNALPFTLRLPARAHVYDCRRGAYLGEVETIEGEALRGVAQLYALLPYRVTGLTLTAPAQAAPGDALDLTAQVAAEGATPEAHVVHIEVIGPGEEVGARAGAHWYARNVTCEAGRATATVPLALSDPAGEWTIVARDVISGEEARARVRVGG